MAENLLRLRAFSADDQPRMTVNLSASSSGLFCCSEISVALETAPAADRDAEIRAKTSKEDL